MNPRPCACKAPALPLRQSTESHVRHTVPPQKCASDCAIQHSFSQGLRRKTRLLDSCWTQVGTLLDSCLRQSVVTQRQKRQQPDRSPIPKNTFCNLADGCTCNNASHRAKSIFHYSLKMLHAFGNARSCRGFAKKHQIEERTHRNRMWNRMRDVRLSVLAGSQWQR